MTAILRIVEDGDLKYEVALTQLERVGGITFYELDLAEIPNIPDPLWQNERAKIAVRLHQLDDERRKQGGQPYEPGGQPHEDTP